ncbi:MAG TPA: 30S ribosomal protein S3 [Nitrososphaeraceae archaeon]|jgi:small subunit ribosomal protein S3|nr:30S ribosomal protein S3 [Nitrososphaeraceae archaeon]
MSAVKNVIKSNYRNMELDEFLSQTLKDAGYGYVDVQKTPIGTRITLYVTRPGLVIGRKGTGIKDLTSKLEQKFGLSSPQISVMEVAIPELNPKIMCNRIAQLIERGTAFRRAALWTINTVMSAGALGVEVSISGKLRSERAHFEKHSAGIIPKSGDVASRVVDTAITHVLTKMGLMGVQLRIAKRDELPEEFELVDNQVSKGELPAKPEVNVVADSEMSSTNRISSSTEERQERALAAEGSTNG